MAVNEPMDFLTHLDEQLLLSINGRGVPALDVFFTIVTFGGHGAALAILVVGTMAVLDKQRLKEHFLPMLLSVVMGAIAVEAVKWEVGRARPARHFLESAEHTALLVRMPFEELYDRSFPSGHTQAAFGTATYVALMYPRLALPALLLASLVGLSRVYLGVHFPLDVLVGALVGIGFSFAGFRLGRRRSLFKRTR